MDVLVINYTDWIGYHIVNTLLNEGYRVTGIEGDTGNPMLKDYFIRNSNFHHTEEMSDKTFTHIVGVKTGHEQYDQGEGAHYYLINPTERGERENTLVIQAPLLFGEFMPMDEKGYFDQGKKVLFTTDRFKNEAIFIEDFMDIFIKWMQSPPENREITVKRGKGREKQDVILEKTFFIHENIPIGTKLQNVIGHYKQYEALYPQIKEN